MGIFEDLWDFIDKKEEKEDSLKKEDSPEDNPEDYEVDKRTGVRYKKMKRIKTDFQTVGDLISYAEENGLPIDPTLSLKEASDTYLPHLNQPLSASEKAKILEIRREITRRQNEEYEEIMKSISDKNF